MNEIQLFNYGNSAVRIVMHGNPPAPWFVAKDVCDILGYTNVTKALNDHLDEDERSSLTIRYGTSAKGGNPNMNIINESGLYCLTLRSNMPKAKEFRKWVTGTVLPQVMRYGLPEPENKLSEPILFGAKMVLEAAGIKENQLALALDKIVKHYTGQSMLELSGVTLIAPTKCQLLNPTEIGKHFGVSGRKVNEILCKEGYQVRVGTNYEPLELGQPYAVMLDTGKQHSDGTPIRQLKWESSFLTEIEELFELPLFLKGDE